MSYQMTVPDDEAFRWLQTAIFNVSAKARANPALYCEHAPNIEILVEAITKAVHTKDHEDVIQKKAPLPIRTPKRTQERPAVALCSSHPLYGAHRSPRTDCGGCWAAYERLNPNRAQLARRKFQRRTAS